MHSMAIKHSTGGGRGRWNLKKYAKRVLFKANFAVFWAQKEVLRPLFKCKTHYSVKKGVCSSSRLVPMQMHPSMDILDTQTAPKMPIFGHC